MTEFINYLVTSHGNRIEQDYIELPSGIRVIMLCTDSLCPASFPREKSLYNLSMSDIDPRLNNLEKIWYFTKQMEEYNYCIFSGNIDDDFVKYMPMCKNRTFNYAPNINFSAETGYNFRDGIHKLPIRPKLVSTINNNLILNSDQVKENLAILPSNSNDPTIALIRPSMEKTLNVKVEFDSYYMTFHKEREPKYPSVRELRITTLEDLINYIKKREKFNTKKCMITIFVSACLSNKNALIPSICMISLKTYNKLQVSFYS